MAFAAVTILMDTLHQHFLQSTPRFPLRNKTNVKLLYKNLSSLQTSLEQDFKVGEYDEAMKALEAQIRDVSIELRFQIEDQLRLFYLGKSMKLRLHSAQKLLPILNRATKTILNEATKSCIETMDLLYSVFEKLGKHFMLPVSGMPAHIKKGIKSFYTQLNAKSDDKLETGLEDYFCKAESIIRQELRAPSYLKKYMKQRIHARHKIHQIFMQGIKLTSYIKKEVLKVKNVYYNQSNTPLGNNINSASLRGPDRDSITVGDSLQHTTIEMVGCDDEFNMIMDMLNPQSKQREIVSIVGMGGIGKTTLAKRIYGDASFISRFDCRAWVTISQVYSPTEVFKALLRSLAPRVYEENYEASKNELADVVYKCLKRQRYLIIIDDIWSTDVWCDLQKCFPDDNNQSRMLLTTRLKNVADYVGSSGNLCHTMRFLDPYESWMLFYNQVLPQRITLSPEFERIGRQIVMKCKGLPLVQLMWLLDSSQTPNKT